MANAQLFAKYETALAAFNATGRLLRTREFDEYQAAKKAMIEGTSESARAEYFRDDMAPSYIVIMGGGD